ncbi:hypothetical protein EON65_19825 [archaeon]|nr:MAG: hypothetical protein EON65_19825 [archaeon]
MPGFGSTRLLLSTVAEELDSWRLQVEDTVYQLFELYIKIAQGLADKLTLQVIMIYLLLWIGFNYLVSLYKTLMLAISCITSLFLPTLTISLIFL